MKKYIFLLCLLAQMHNAAAQKLSATLDYSRFQLDSTRNLLGVYLQFDGSSVQFRPNKQGKFQGRVLVTLWVQDSTKTYFADKFELASPLFADTSYKKKQLSVYKNISLPNGKYKLMLVATDAQSTDTTALRAELPIQLNFASNKIQISDLMLIESYQRATPKSTIVKHDLEILPYSASFYPASINQLKVFAEIYHVQKVLGDTAAFAVAYRINRAGLNISMQGFGKISRQKANPVNVSFTTIDISQLPSGNYDLAIDVISAEGKIIAKQTKFFQRSNPKADAGLDFASKEQPQINNNFAEQLAPEDLKKYIRALEPIANRQEVSSIVSLSKNGNVTAQRNYFYDFWRRRNAENPAKAFKEYAELVAIAEANYSTKTLFAHETDRGRVFLQHGKPNQIENEYTDRQRASHLEISSLTPYEIWHYYDLKENNQTNVIFVFVQANLGNNDYKLLHSTAQGEFRNPDWREALNRKATDSNNLDYMNPAK
jgi:GWxTD domain-containing protein